MKKYITIVIAFLVAFSLSAQTQTFVKRQADSIRPHRNGQAEKQDTGEKDGEKLFMFHELAPLKLEISR